MSRIAAGETSMSRTSLTVRSLALGLAIVVLPGVAAAQGASQQSHTVRSGDTLWSLAQRYLGDPYLWPEIFRLNTAVVEDPHWIYPGEVLRLAAGDAVASVPLTDTPAPSDTMVAMAPAAPAELPLSEASADASSDAPLFGSAGRESMMRETLRAYTEQPYRALRRSEFFSSGFLTEDQALPYGRVLGNVQPSQIRAITSNSTATLFTSIAVEPPAGGSYQVGDSLLLVILGPDYGRYGQAVVPTGLARVTGVSVGHPIAEVLAVYGPIRNGQLVLPAEKFADAGSVRAVAVADGVRGSVIGTPRPQELKSPQDVIFIDKGRADGVAPGDLFDVRRTAERLPDGRITVDEVMATMQIVHVRERTATARVLGVSSPLIPAGTEVRQVAKLPR
jgi:LysM repeat protein